MTMAARLRSRRHGHAPPAQFGAGLLAPAGGLWSRRGAARGEVAGALQPRRTHPLGGTHLRHGTRARARRPRARLPGSVGWGAVPAPLSPHTGDAVRPAADSGVVAAAARARGPGGAERALASAPTGAAAARRHGARSRSRRRARGSARALPACGRLANRATGTPAP